MGGVFIEVTDWFLFAVGALFLAGGVMLARRRGSTRGRVSRTPPRLLVCVGLYLALGAAVRLCGWTGYWLDAVDYVSLAASVVVYVIGGRVLNRREAALTPDHS